MDLQKTAKLGSRCRQKGVVFKIFSEISLRFWVKKPTELELAAAQMFVYTFYNGDHYIFKEI